MLPLEWRRASFAMTQDKDGKYYLICEASSANATIEIWSSNAGDGINFSKVFSQTTLNDPLGNTMSKGKLIIGNSRCYSEKDGFVPLMFEGSSGGTECFYYTSIALPCAEKGVGESDHVHTWDNGVETTQPGCTEGGIITTPFL